MLLHKLPGQPENVVYSVESDLTPLRMKRLVSHICGYATPFGHQPVMWPCPANFEISVSVLMSLSMIP
jgi:hypothetical protein